MEKNDSGKAEADSKRSKWKSQEEALKNEEDIAESGRIFIRNLSYTTTEKDLEDLFVKHGELLKTFFNADINFHFFQGPLAEVNLPIDSTTRQSKGFAVVTFMMPEHAVKAYTELDGSILQGRMMHLLPGKAKDISEEEKLDGKASCALDAFLCERITSSEFANEGIVHWKLFYRTNWSVMCC